MGDAFRDRLESSLASLRGNDAIAAKIDVPPDRRFVGFDNYQQVINSGVDVVLLCSPPALPARSTSKRRCGPASTSSAKSPWPSMPPAFAGSGRLPGSPSSAGSTWSSGLCWRYHGGMRETFRRIHDGAVGDIVALQCNYNTGTLWHRAREAGWSDMEWQMRNWLYFTWLSGDFNVEQHIHSLDKMMWAMRDRAAGPLRRPGRPAGAHRARNSAISSITWPASTNIPAASSASASCRQQAGCANEVKDYVMGSHGQGRRHGPLDHRPTPPGVTPPPSAAATTCTRPSTTNCSPPSAPATPINNGDYMCKSTLMAIMGRMACYTGQAVTWEQAMNSREDLSPPRYDWIELPVPPVARPGITRLT